MYVYTYRYINVCTYCIYIYICDLLLAMLEPQASLSWGSHPRTPQLDLTEKEPGPHVSGARGPSVQPKLPGGLAVVLHRPKWRFYSKDQNVLGSIMGSPVYGDFQIPQNVMLR